MMFFAVVGFLLALTYLLLTGNWEPLNVILSVVVAALVLSLVDFQTRTISVRQVPGLIVASIRYMVIILIDMLLSGLQVARLILDPRLPISPSIVALPTKALDEAESAFIAHAISVTPGEYVLEMGDQGIMYTHILETGDPADLIANVERLRRTMPLAGEDDQS